MTDSDNRNNNSLIDDDDDDDDHNTDMITSSSMTPTSSSQIRRPPLSPSLSLMTNDTSNTSAAATTTTTTTTSDNNNTPFVTERAWERRLRAKQSMTFDPNNSNTGGTAANNNNNNNARDSGISHHRSSMMDSTADQPGAFRVAGLASASSGAAAAGNDAAIVGYSDEENNQLSWRSSSFEMVTGGAADFIPVYAELAPEELQQQHQQNTTIMDEEEGHYNRNNNNNGSDDMNHITNAEAANAPAEMVLSVEAIKDDDDDEEGRQIHRRWWWWLGGGILLVVIIVVVTLTVVLTTSDNNGSSNSSNNNNNNNKTPTSPSPTPSPSMAPTIGAALVAGRPTNLTLLGQSLSGLPLLSTSTAGTYSQFGASVAMDATGTIMAVGAVQYQPSQVKRRAGLVQVYQYNNTIQQWQPLGYPVIGQGDQEYLGRSVALSSNGQIMAIGAFGYRNQAGVVRVYQYQPNASNNNNNTWVQLGNDLLGSNAQDQVGWGTIALSYDGMILAYGALLNDFNSTCQASGRVKVVVYDADHNVWRQRGQDLIGKDCADQFGISVAMSQEGSIVAVGARNYNATQRFNNGTSESLPLAGLVQVYQYQSSNASWQQLGQDILGNLAGDRMGRAVSLSATGRTLCVGASQAEANETFAPGYAQVYVYQQDTLLWLPQGPTLYGNSSGDYFGGNVVLSADGTILSICARQSNHSFDVFRGGYCQLYARHVTTNGTAVTWEAIGRVLRGRANYDQFGGSLSLSRDGKIIAIGAAQDSANETSQQGYVQVWQAEQQLFS